MPRRYRFLTTGAKSAAIVALLSLGGFNSFGSNDQGQCHEEVALKSLTPAHALKSGWELPWLLNHSVSGSQHRETVVLIHGLTADLRTFENVARSLSQYYRVVSVDLRGMGNTPAYGWNYSSGVLAKDVAQLLKHLQSTWTNPPSRFHVLGHSFGARVALKFCDRYPDMAQSLIVEDMHFGRYKGSELSTLQRGIDRATELLKTKNPGCNRVQMLQPGNHEMWTSLADKEFVVPLFASQVRHEEYSGELSRLKVPLLLVAAAGFRGALGADGLAHAKRHLRPGLPLHIASVPNTGHDVHNDNPDGYLSVVGTFIAESLKRLD